MSIETAYEWGLRHKSCPEALELRRRYATQADCYLGCQRGDWLIWQLQQLDETALIAVRPALQRAIDTIVDRAVSSHALHCGIPVVEEWAARWLGGADRSEKSAWAAEAAEAAAWAPWAPWAAWAAARTAEARSCERLYAQERRIARMKWQERMVSRPAIRVRCADNAVSHGTWQLMLGRAGTVRTQCGLVLVLDVIEFGGPSCTECQKEAKHAI